MTAATSRLTPITEVMRPDGAGPFPTAILLHGCGGLQPLQRRYAEAIRGAGAAAVLIDSFEHRGISRMHAHLTVCTGLRLRGDARAQDLFDVIDWLGGQAWSDPARLCAIGWSHGAWTIMDALAIAGRNHARRPLASRLRSVGLIYPYCGVAALTTGRGWGGLAPDVTAIIAGRDQVVGSRAPLRALTRLKADCVPVDLHLFEDATHAFEDDEASDPRTRYRPDLATRATALMVGCVLG